MKTILAFFKISAVFFFILLFLLNSFMARVFIWNKWQLTKFRGQMISLYSQIGIRILNLKPRFSKPLENHQNSLFVSNHLSYIDVLILASQAPMNFVTSIEIKNTPFLGQIVQMAGCLFVERRNKSNLTNEIKEITEALANGINVTIFPEATSTNGESVLRFRRPLYAAAIESDRNVVPLCLNYKKISGKSIDLENRDDVFWYGKMSFLPHLWSLCLQDNVEIEIQVLGKIENEENLTATDLASESHKRVSEVFIPCLN